MIFKSLIRFFFLDMALDALTDKVRWNWSPVTVNGKYPRTRHGVLQAARDGMFPTMGESTFHVDVVEKYMNDHGLEEAISALIYFGGLAGANISDLIMDP